MSHLDGVTTGKTFGVPIINHQAIGTMLAEMAIGVECSRYGGTPFAL